MNQFFHSPENGKEEGIAARDRPGAGPGGESTPGMLAVRVLVLLEGNIAENEGEFCEGLRAVHETAGCKVIGEAFRAALRVIDDRLERAVWRGSGRAPFGAAATCDDRAESLATSGVAYTNGFAAGEGFHWRVVVEFDGAAEDFHAQYAARGRRMFTRKRSG